VNLGENYIDGVLREKWDDATRTYTAWDADGVIDPETPRSYTAEENAAADAEAVGETLVQNKSTIELNLEEDLATMQAIKDTDNSVINDSPASYIKDIAVAVRRLIKMELEDFEQAE
jgi:hypothetical protein